MMQKKHTTHLILLASIFTAVSCTVDIDIKLDDNNPKLVIYGELTTDTTTHIININKSTDYYTPGKMPGVSNARVTLSWDNNTIVLTENDSVSGCYQTPNDFAGIVGKTYKLTVTDVDIDQNGDIEMYEAEATILPKADIDSIALQFLPMFNAELLRVWIKDDPTTDNFYLVKALKNNYNFCDSLNEWRIGNDKLVGTENGHIVIAMTIDQEKEDEIILSGDTIAVELSNISNDFFTFISECKNASRAQFPLFSRTPGNIQGNISNNAIGFFTAYSITRKSLIAKPIMNR